MHSLHIYHTRNFHKFFHTDMWRFELSIWLCVLGRTLIAVFIPIILLQIGYSIAAVLGFYLLLTIFNVPLNFFTRKMIAIFGARKIFIASLACVILYFALLSGLKLDQWWLFALIAFFAACYDAFYWVSHLYLFEKVNHKIKNISKDTGLLYIAKFLAAMLGPAIGAIVLIFTSSKVLIWISVGFFILSAIPLFKLHIEADKPGLEEKILSFKEFFKEKQERRNYISVALFALHRATEKVIWPIFIFVTLGSIHSVAIVPILVSFTSIVFSYVAGKAARNKRERVIAIGAALIGLTWLIRMATQGIAVYYGSVFLVGFFALFVNVALYSNVFSRGKKIDNLSAVTYNNAASMSAQVVLYLVLFLSVTVFEVSFIIAAVSVFILMLVNSYYLISAYKTKG